MLLKKALFLVSSENEIEPLLEFGKVFKGKYNVEIDALYVKDILKYEIFPVTIEGIGLNIGANYAFKEYKELEEKSFKAVKEKMGREFSEVYSKDGETVEVALDELKKYDLLVVVKNEKVSPYLKELLRSNFKPLIILPNIEKFSLDNIVLLDDGAYNANKTLFTFFYMFDEQKIDVLRVNVNSEDNLKERFGDNYNLIEKTGETFKTIMEESEKYDFILMGDLRYTVMVERITGKLGIRLLENLNKPIFIV
ncbi:MAG: GntR family transcriptional regulator [Leptotrichiaceae bacterium]|nr:GntR family transcriptional regulator [Leptotrichiaceae bacterium]